MGFFDDLGKALKKVEEDVKKSDLDRHVKDLEQGLNKAGTKQTSSSPSAPAATRASPARPAGSAHPGYQKLAAWMKRNYRDRISGGSGTSFDQGTRLEQLAAEACSGLSSKARTGFLAYLKKQNYEPLLK